MRNVATIGAADCRRTKVNVAKKKGKIVGKQTLTSKRTFAKMIPVRDVIIARMNELEWSAYKLAKAVAGKMTAQTVYDYVAEPPRTKINDEFVGHLIDALGLHIVPKK